jgi:hypothetical protein
MTNYIAESYAELARYRVFIAIDVILGCYATDIALKEVEAAL